MSQWGIKRCRTGSNLKDTNWKKKRRRILCVDRLTSLPDEILSRILNLLPTKEVAAMQVLSKRMTHALSLVTTLDLDNSPISHSAYNPHLLERFPLFKSFVVNAVHKLSRSDAVKPLTRFKLCLGTDHAWYNETRASLPYLESACLNGWISYPLAHRVLRDLDLTFHIRNRKEYKLPPQLFDCRSLESFRLLANILIDDADIPPLICLPNLKLVYMATVRFTGDDFVTRLVSSCPALEDLNVGGCEWKKLDRVTISSHSLRRLDLGLNPSDEDTDKMTELVLIDTPNLQYLNFNGDLAYRYSVTHMNALVEAEFDVVNRFILHNLQTCFRIQLSFLSVLSNVQHLYIHGDSLELISSVPELQHELPVFHNLKTLKLGCLFGETYRWDTLLLLILRTAPLLETLSFPMGLRDSPDRRDKDVIEGEAEGWRRNQTLTSCFLTHLTRVEFGSCIGEVHEVNFIKFFLSKASALKELVIPSSQKLNARQFEELVNKLEELPRASDSCSIIVNQ